ncbi:MAG: hypothetical protein EZS28_000237 [Streblomastix strix]|uniref:Uncharacterized protein n=1 Tax=Streblomastix strix TaxID=222440 RepID=A0A5J4XAV0_9EUKA|nr:MAG: hypothetical protein EZS28_000237 [Streblomastix strix]
MQMPPVKSLILCLNVLLLTINSLPRPSFRASGISATISTGAKPYEDINASQKVHYPINISGQLPITIIVMFYGQLILTPLKELQVMLTLFEFAANI